MTQETIYLLYLDDYHAADVLFLQSLSRALTRPSAGGRIVVHGSGEHAERLLEAEGIFRTRSNGVIPVETPAEHAMVELAIRRLNQKLVSTFTEAVVSAVGVLGTQRRLLSVRNGRVEPGDLAWLRSLLPKGVVPIVAAYAGDHESDRAGEVGLPEAVTGLAKGLHDASVTVVFFTKTNLPGFMRAGEPMPGVRLKDALDPRVIPDMDGLRQIVAGELPVLLTNTTRFGDPGGPTGTRILP